MQVASQLILLFFYFFLMAENVMSLSNDELIVRLTNGGVEVEAWASRPELIKAYGKMKKDAEVAEDEAKASAEASANDGADAPADDSGEAKDGEEGDDKAEAEKPQDDGKELKAKTPAKTAPAPKETKPKAKKDSYEVLSAIKMGGRVYQKGEEIPYFKGIEKMGHAVKL